MAWVRTVVWISSLLLCASASADQVEVKGVTLQGEVVSVSKDGLVFSSEYGKGEITIPWADIDRLDTQKELVVLHGDDALDRGRLMAVENGDTIMLEGPDGKGRIPVADIFAAFDEAAWTDSLVERLRAQYRHWSASLSLSGSLNRGPTNSESLQINLDVERKKSPTRYQLNALYHVANSEDETERCVKQVPPGDPTKCAGRSGSSDQIAKRYYLSGRQEYTFAGPAFAFLTESLERDEVDDIQLRVIGRLGAGYRLVEADWGTLSIDAGPSYLYEENAEDAVSIALGTEGELDLPLGSKLNTRIDWYPSLEGIDDSLFTTKTVLSVPLLSWMSLRLGAETIHEREAGDDGRKNRFKGSAGLSVVF